MSPDTVHRHGLLDMDMLLPQIDIIDDFRRHVLHTDSIFCLKGYNALFEPAPFRHGITAASVSGAAAAERHEDVPPPGLVQGQESGLGTPLCGLPTTSEPADHSQSGSTAAAAQQHASVRIRGARDAWAPGWSAPVPRSYCFSPSLVPRPADWPDHVNAVGFCRDPDAGDDSRFVPPPELEEFLAKGPKPVYIGFGSMAIKDPEARYLFSAKPFRQLWLGSDPRQYIALFSEQACAVKLSDHDTTGFLTSFVPSFIASGGTRL